MARLATDPVRRWRNSPVQREIDSRRERWVWKVVLGVALALTPFAVYLLQTMAYVQTSYAIEEVRSQETRLQEADRRLRIEKAKLEALPAVEARAVHGLGLVHPPPAHTVVVAPGDLAHNAPPGASTPSPATR
jgi:cell division protein FtsL